MQEFSGTTSATASIYEAAFTQIDPATGLAMDPRMPTAPVSSEITQLQVPDSQWPPGPEWPAGATRPPATARSNDGAYYPFSHLLNFFQEVPELPTPSPTLGTPDRYNKRHPKNTALALLMDLVETPSPWIDSQSVVPPTRFAARDWSGYDPDLQPLIASNNAVFAPLRAPYNGISRQVEPGRINLNTISEANVFQGLWSNLLDPSDVDFAPYESAGTPFGGPEDIDHNQNGVNDPGGRAYSGNATAAWGLVNQSRQGYTPLGGSFNPGGSVTRFNPHFPTEFAGIFKPAGEAGMVPITRNPIPAPASVTTPAEGAQMTRHRLGERGVLDIFSRQTPANVTLMRAAPNTPYEAGILSYGAIPLASDATNAQRNAFTDLYPMSRLTNLTSDRSNVFAVYVTVGFFEYDPTTDSIGMEHGADSGDTRRCKAFYIIDRSKPFGYRVGEDHNAKETILLRRYLN